LHKGDYPVNAPHLQPEGTKAGANNAVTRQAPRRWLFLALAMAGVAATLTLGSWQLRRADFKQSTASQIAAQGQLPPLSEWTPTQSNLLHRNVSLRGLWLDAHTVFLDNRFMGGRAGFYVVTPLQLQGTQSIVWVQRGWVARDIQDRARLPELPSSGQEVIVPGRVIDKISRVYALGEAGSSASAPAASAPASARPSRIWQNLPVADLGLGYAALPMAVLQTAPALANGVVQSDGLSRDWPQVDAGVAKHYGYAFQWFALCGLIIVLYVWFQILAPRRAVRS
jgi:surfeit locus 1 family protein